jgi:hypothetical protein
MEVTRKKSGRKRSRRRRSEYTRERPRQYQESSNFPPSSAKAIGIGAVYDAEKKKLTQNQKKNLKKKQFLKETSTMSDKQAAVEQDDDENEAEAAVDDENSTSLPSDSIEGARNECMTKLLKLIDNDEEANSIDNKAVSNNATTSNSRRRSASKKNASEQLEELKNCQLDSILKVVNERPTTG